MEQRTATEIGNARIGHVLWSGGADRPVLLETLLYLVGISRADVAGLTGLTNSRIGHYLHYEESVPEQRQRLLYAALHDITVAWEENLAGLDETPEEFEEALVAEAVPVARAIVGACRKVLADYEAAEKEAGGAR